MLKAVLESEVEEFLGRRSYERTGEFRGYRNNMEIRVVITTDDTDLDRWTSG